MERYVRGMCEYHRTPKPGDDHNSSSETLTQPSGISHCAHRARDASTEVDTRLSCPHKINERQFLKERIHSRNTTDF